LDARKDFNHKMHQFGATGQWLAVRKLCLDATFLMQNVGMIWNATHGWKAYNVL